MISHRLWQERFVGVSDIVGRQLTVQRVPFTIVGVMPAGFSALTWPYDGRDVALAAEPLVRGQEIGLGEGSCVGADHGAVKPGQSLQQANAAIRSCASPD